MTRKTTKTKDKVFSSNQFAMSEVPINEFVQTKTNAAIKLSNQIFFLNGILLFEIAIVKLIKSISFVCRIGNGCRLKKYRDLKYTG